MEYLEFCRLISDYLDRELSREICDEMERMMEQFPHFQCFFNTFHETISLCGDLEEVEVPETVHRRLHRTLEIYLED